MKVPNDLQNLITNKPAVQDALVKQLFASHQTSIVSGIVLVSMLAYMQWDVVDHTVVTVWFVLMQAIQVARIMLLSFYRSRPVESGSFVKTRLRMFRIGVLLGGIGWGASAYWLYPLEEPQHQMLIIILLIGLSTASIASYAADLISAGLFLNLTLLPLIVRLLFVGDSTSTALALSGLLIIIFMSISIWKVNKSLVENIQLRLDANSREHLIKTSEEGYRLLLRHSPVGIFHFDKNLDITYFNDRFKELFENRDRSQRSATAVFRSLHSIQVWLSKVIDGETISIEHACDRLSGQSSQSWIQLSCAPSYDKHGHVDGGVAIVEDISLRKRTEEEALLSKQELESKRVLFQTLLDNAPIGIWLLGADGKIKFINRAFCSSVGVTEEQFKSVAHYSELLTPQVSENCIKSDEACFQVDGVHTSQEWIPFVDGKEHLLEIHKVKLINNDGEIVGLIGLATDISQRHHLETALIDSHQTLRDLSEQSEILREEERKYIAREVHDELGQILTALRMDVALISLRFGAQNFEMLEKTRGMTVLLDKAGQCVRNIVSDLRPNVLDIGLVSALKWLGDEYAEHTGNAFNFETNEESIDVEEVRAASIFRIVQESLTNASRYAGKCTLQIKLIRQGDDLRIEIRDTGRGFDYDDIPKQKSFGLLGMRERAISLGGELQITSEKNKGVFIELLVPISRKGDGQ